MFHSIRECLVALENSLAAQCIFFLLFKQSIIFTNLGLCQLHELMFKSGISLQNGYMQQEAMCASTSKFKLYHKLKCALNLQNAS